MPKTDCDKSCILKGLQIQRAERSSKYQITPGETILLCGSVLRTETVWFGPVELGTTATLKALARS